MRPRCWTTSNHDMFRPVFAASSTAARTASAKLTDEIPTSSMILKVPAIMCLLSFERKLSDEFNPQHSTPVLGWPLRQDTVAVSALRSGAQDGAFPQASLTPKWAEGTYRRIECSDGPEVLEYFNRKCCIIFPLIIWAVVFQTAMRAITD